MSEIATYEKSFDLIIVGGGACGLAAAAEAGEKGVNAVVIEKRHSTGGNAMFADGMLAAGSHIQKKQLLDVPPDAILKFAMDYSHQSLNARLLRAFIDQTADNIRWLEEKGIRFHVDPYIPGQVYQTYHIPEGRMKEVMSTLKRELVELNVPTITDTEVTKILKSDDGHVEGVLCRDLEREFIVKAPNVLICTGGYSGNKEMLRKYFPFDSENLICWGLHHNGDGIRMATEAGAANEGLGILCLSGPHIPATVKARIDIPGEEPCFIQVSALGREPTGVWVNKHGKRYVAESIGLNGHEAPNAVIRQPDQTSFALFDSNTIQEMEEHGLIKGLNQDTRNKAIERSHLPGLAEQLKFQSEGMIYGEISDPDKCTGCGTCVMNCAAGAIKLDTIVASRNEMSACRYACPLHTDMRTYFHLLKQGKKQEAYEVLREYNPLPAVTGRVCPHYCEGDCARQHVDKSVNVRQLERFIADSCTDVAPAPVEENGKRVAVIGSGPSGIACAYFLRRKGYAVTVYERMPEAGGNLRYGIPAYRLPKDVLDSQLDYIRQMGIEIKTGVDVGKDLVFSDICRDYNAVFFAIGAQNSAKISIPGVENPKVIGGRDYLRDYTQYDVHGKVVVVGGGPIVYGAMSAVDMALWDIKGKALGQPVYQLLGGKTNDDLRTYASQIQFGWSDKGFQPLGAPEQYAEAACIAVSEGYDAVKVDPLQVDENGVMSITSSSNRILDRDTFNTTRKRLKAIRDAVGDKVDIIVELHCGTNVSSGIQLARLGEEFNCMFIEEPVHCMNPSLQRKVSRSVNIPLAAGERIYTRWGYSRYFEDQSLNVIQPDICLVGGISEAKKVCDYASVYDVTVQAHVCGSPVSTAAALQVEAAISNFQIHELHIVGLQGYNRQLCLQDNLPVRGKFKVPDEPGLGVDLNGKFLETQPKLTVK